MIGRYWINFTEPGRAHIHVAGCGYCIEGEDGTIPQEEGFNQANWRGHYATKGTAVDAAEIVGREAELASCCR